MRKKRPVHSALKISKIENLRSKVPTAFLSTEPYEFIRLIRERLGMTQAQLGKRCGLSQQYVAAIESGKKDIRISTLSKILRALECALVTLPVPRAAFEKMVWKKAMETAKKSLKSVLGNMALEDQLPKALDQRVILEREIARLSEKPSSEIWDEE